MIILDSVSHSNAVRNLPKTMEYITKVRKATVLDYYIKVSESSVSNFRGFILGKNSSWDGPIDPIWKDYHRDGYATFFESDGDFFPYGIDMSFVDSKGRKWKTADHSLRPFWFHTYYSMIIRRSDRLCYDTSSTIDLRDTFRAFKGLHVSWETIQQIIEIKINF